jgi:DNA-binding CsgD family transcriptional regulator
MMMGDYGRAHSCLSESIDLLRAAGNANFLAYALRRMGQVALRQGQPDRARALFQDSLSLNGQVRSQRGVAACLVALAGVAAAEGQPLPAARLLGAAECLLERAGERLSPIDRAEAERQQAALRPRLGDAGFEAALAHGRALPLPDVIASVLAPPGQPASGGRAGRQAEQASLGGLTRREREVAALVAQGRSNREIAAELVIGVKTVEAHVSRVLGKLGFTSRAQVAAWAVDKGLAEPPSAHQ